MLLNDYLSQKRGLPPLKQALSSIKSYPLKNDFTFSTVSLNEIFLGHRSISSEFDDFITSLLKKDELTTEAIYNFIIPLFFEKAQLSQTLELNKTIYFFEENLERLNLTRNNFF